MALSRYDNKDYIGDHEKGREPKRYSSVKDYNLLTGDNQSSVDDVDQRLFAKLTETTDLRWKFGIIQGKDGKIPEADGVPRMFIMGKGEDGHDTVMSLEEAGVTYGSKEFWRQSQLGNVFAYPAGETKPVQMRLELHGNSPIVNYSKLIDSKDMPQPRKKQPGFFQRILHSINKNWASSETRDYYATLNDGEAVTEKLKEMENVREGTVKDEMEDLRSREEDLEVEAEQAEFEAHVQKTVDQYDRKLNGHKTYRNITDPEPVFDESIEKTAKNKGLYTKQGFAKLEKINANKSDFQVGGQPVSDDAYMGLVASCSLDPKNGENMFKAGQEYQKHLAESLEPFGIAKEDFYGKYPSVHSDFVFGDFLDHANLRDNEENQFEAVINPGRKDAVKLLQDYKNNVPGCKKALAEALTRGIRTVSNLTGADRKDITDQLLKSGRIMNAAAELMEKDPELKSIAMAKPPAGCGLDEKDLKAVKGLAVIDKADLAAAEAEKKIAQSALNGTKLSAEEKRKLAVDVVSARIMKNKYYRDIQLNLRDNKEYKAAGEKAQSLREAAMQDPDLMAGPSPDRPAPPKGKLYFDQASSYQNYVQHSLVTIPDTVIQLSEKGDKGYRALAEKIVDDRMMYTLNSKNLDGELNAKDYEGTRLINLADKAVSDIMAQKDAAKRKPVQAEVKAEGPEADDPEMGENLKIDDELSKGGPQL
ncbi:MAG: hypothetical protein II974_11320 [Firmicutes bacterium]|nr:hypothetical protein [Bacillota bacterium]